MNTIIDYLDHWAAVQPTKRFGAFLDLTGSPRETHTYRSFDLRSRFLAEYLHAETNITYGDRVLLVYSPGLEIVAACVACARLGAIAIPLPPPRSFTTRGGARLLGTVARDCGATAALLDGASLPSLRASLSPDALPLTSYVVTDELHGDPTGTGSATVNDVLLVQYTSGSTDLPKGVVVSHANVIHNCHVTTDHQPIGVSWLPQFHDMGLIGYYMFLIVTGGTTYGFAPFDFLRRPVLWLEVLSRYRGTFSSSPNFGFEYCLSEERVPDEQLAGLDLSSVRVLMNGSEPVRARTYQRFLDRFAPHGLRPEAHVAAYGLAENTLAVSSNGRRTLAIDRRALHRGSVSIVEPDAASALDIVSCGAPLEGIRVRVVDPKTAEPVAADELGEIWVAGASKCQGYWNRPGLSGEVFSNPIANDPDDKLSYLRTGDLGFLDRGELFVCGRLKHVIIARGRNHHAEDLERAVEAECEHVRPGSVVAFGTGDGGDEVVVVIGVRTASNLPRPDDVTRALRSQDYDGPHTIVFSRDRSVARTTSGKLARSRVRERWLNDALNPIETHVRRGHFADATPSEPVLLASYEHFLTSYALLGDEDATLAEAGLDSLALAELLVHLEELAQSCGVPLLRDVLDAPLLQRLSVSCLTALVKRLEGGDRNSLADLKTRLTALKREHHEGDRAVMLRDARLDATHVPSGPMAERVPASVLLTGGSGFLGPFLLHSLLDHTRATYHVLTRGSSGDVARERLRDGLIRAGVYTSFTAEAFEKRVRVICGDLSRDDLGLERSHWASLARGIDTIVHNAAHVDYVLNYQSLRATNVDGTRELLRFACTDRRKSFHLVSSTIVFGWSAKAQLLEHDSNPEMAELDFGYAQTKWVAEQLALTAMRRGLDVKIYRPSFLTASTKGLGDRDDVVVRLLAFMINHGLVPRTLNQLSFMPVDIAANNLAAIMAKPPRDSAVFHVTVDDYYNLLDVTGVMSRTHGIDFRHVALDAFAAEMRARCSRHDPAFPLLDFVARSHPKFKAIQAKRYTNSAFRTALARSHNGQPDPSLDATVSYLMTFMASEGLIPGTARRRSA